MKEKDKTKHASVLRPIVNTFDLQGHRGARGLLPENTIPAFLKALEIGVTTLEMDVVISKDSQVVVSHDPWFSATICSLPSGQPVPPDQEQLYKIYEMTYEEIRQYDCGIRGHPGFPRQESLAAVKPLLRDVIRTVESYISEHGLHPVWYNIETKSRPGWDGVFHPDPETFTGLLYDVLIEAGVKNRSILQSFDPRTLQAARRLDVDWYLALLIAGESDAGIEANLKSLGFTPHIYSPAYRLVNTRLVDHAHALNMRVIPWSVNTIDEMKQLVSAGVDGLITDYPDIGVTLLRSGN